jgi:hypothetical protein
VGPAHVAILPQILPPPGVPVESTLEIGGFLILATGVVASLGSMAAPRLAELLGDRRAVLWFLLGSSLLLASLAAAGGVWSFNSARIGAAFMGPVLAATLRSSMPPAAVYLALAALGVAVVPLVARMDRRSRLRDDPGGGMTS